jgi:hypothetical protein
MKTILRRSIRCGIWTVIAILLGAIPGLKSADYSEAVLDDAPLAYFRLNDPERTNVTFNAGSLGATGNATNLNVRPVGGVLAGAVNYSAFFNGAGARAIVPFDASLNPASSESFTIEAWFNTSVEVTDAPGPAPLMNRYSYSGVNRQGWVYFQRSPTTGWNFRMYSGAGSSVSVDVTGQATNPGAGQAGTWNHVVTTWNGSVGQATMYVNGEQVAQSAAGLDYAANTDDHPASEAVNGPAGLGIGAYNNTEPGSNPFHGKIDEVAFYDVLLSPARILAHYQNATNAARAESYSSLVLSDGPVGYWQFDELLAETDLAVNIGSLGPAGDGTNSLGVNHPVPGAVVAAAEGANQFRPRNTGGAATTLIPWNAELNPFEWEPFTVEAWFFVAEEVTDDPGPSPIMNRFSYPGADRQGWVYFQRSPETGWNFRTYTGFGTGTGVNITGQASTPNAGRAGTWNHVVTTWDGIETATLYVNGEQVASGTGVYFANSDDHSPEAAPNGPAGLSLGGYNNTEPGANPFHGRVDEFAFYDYELAPEQILAHYENAINPAPAVTYESLVQSDGPVAFLRFDEPPFRPAANLGTLGATATGNVLFTTNDQAGPRPPDLPGFESDNAAVPFDGVSSHVSVPNPSGLDIAGQITLEAWINPEAAQAAVTDIVARGNAADGTVGVALRILDGNAYSIQASDGITIEGASSSIPPSDLGGGDWIHLAGTFDGGEWRLYRNGVEVASEVGNVGAPQLDNGEWSIGAGDAGRGQLFAGRIDEVAIYDRALSAGRIAAHHAAATGSVSPPLEIAIALVDGQVSISWSAGTLEQADEVTGLFSTVEGAVSPYAPPPGPAARFYRLREQQ